MNGNTASAIGQASIVESYRIGRDDSILFFLGDGRRLQLSASGIAILAAIDELGKVRSRNLHAVLAEGDGPVTASRRASLSRTLRRLDEQGVIFAQNRSEISCSEIGVAIVERLRKNGVLTAEQRVASWEKLTGRTQTCTPLTLPLREDAA